MSASTIAATMPANPEQRIAVNGRAATVWLGVAAIVALALALRLPAATTVLGLVAFGVLHNVLELRYVAGRYESVLSGRFLILLIGLVTGIATLRLLPLGAASQLGEVALCYTVLGVACARVLAGRRWLLVLAIAVLGGAACVSAAFPAYHFVVLGHLHNVVPLFFLWDLSRAMATRARAVFRTINLAWVLLVPAALLSGLLDPVLRGSPASFGGLGGVVSFDPGKLAAPYTPPALTDVGLRFLAVFAFMQTMHYVVWVAVLPRFAPEAAARFDARVPALRRGRAWLLGAGLAVILGVVFALDYATGRTLYASAASYHAYLEFPVLLALILAHPRQPTTPRQGELT